MSATYPRPPPSAGTAALASWERAIGRAWAQHIENGGPVAPLERRYGVGREQLAVIAGKFGIAARKGGGNMRHKRT